jgi:small-conductance mechanosensitive channel
MGNFFGFFSDILHYNLFPLGEAKITPLSLIYLVGFSILLFWASKKLRDLLTSRLLAKTHLDIGAQQAIGTVSRYLILFLGFLVILQTVGIDLTTLNVLAGAVGIGVGFGLQNVASNFIAGIIILFERPVKIGDRIEVDGADGKVVSVGARSTVVKTNDNITIIIPNSKLITEDVINWTYDSRNPRIRLRVPVGVSYDSDVNLVKRLLCEVGIENPDVLQEPEPKVRLIEFGDNSLNFELWVWSKAKLHRKTVLLSDLNFAIWEKFKANNIEIPFPQRDLNIRGGRLGFDGNAAVFGQKQENNSRPNGVYNN